MRAAILSVALLAATVATAAPLRIMPLGDSITTGSSVGDLTPGGYRTTLYNLLDAAGYDFDFVGSQTDNPGPIPDNDHEGHGGYQLNNIRGVMGVPLQTYQPDVVLLLGGTNDVTYSVYADPTLTAEGIAGRLDTLLSDLYFNRPTATVFVGTIPPVAPSEPAHSALSAEVNALFPGVLAARAAAGQDVHLVDLRSILTSDDLSDWVHPSPVGYAKMGQAWYDAISGVIPPPPPPPIVAWANTSGGLFSVGANWTGGAAPLATQSADFNLSSAYTVTLDSDVANKRLLVRNDDVTLDLGGFLYIFSETTEPSVVVGAASGDIGKLTVTNGTLSGTSGAIGTVEDSSGQVIVGQGGTWTSTQGVMVGGGTGLLQRPVWRFGLRRRGAEHPGRGTLNLEDGTITAAGVDVAGGAVTVTSGVLSVSSALLSVSGGGTFDLAGGAVNSPLVNITGGSLHLNGGALELAGGLLNVTNAGSLTGVFSVDGGSTVGVGGNGSTWTNAGNLRVGDSGAGTLTASGGSAISADTVQVGIAAASSGSITVSGTASTLSASAR